MNRKKMTKIIIYLLVTSFVVSVIVPIVTLVMG